MIRPGSKNAQVAIPRNVLTLVRYGVRDRIPLLLPGTEPVVIVPP